MELPRDFSRPVTIALAGPMLLESRFSGHVRQSDRRCPLGTYEPDTALTRPASLDRNRETFAPIGGSERLAAVAPVVSRREAESRASSGHSSQTLATTGPPTRTPGSRDPGVPLSGAFTSGSASVEAGRLK